MPHYFFHIRDNDEMIIDDLGLELPDLGMAVTEARKGISSMLADAELQGDDISGQVMEVTDSAGAVLTEISFREVARGDETKADSRGGGREPGRT